MTISGMQWLKKWPIITNLQFETLEIKLRLIKRLTQNIIIKMWNYSIGIIKTLI